MSGGKAIRANPREWNNKTIQRIDGKDNTKEGKK